MYLSAFLHLQVDLYIGAEGNTGVDVSIILELFSGESFYVRSVNAAPRLFSLSSPHSRRSATFSLSLLFLQVVSPRLISLCDYLENTACTTRASP